MNITQKGQVTIPVEIRERHGFLPYTHVEFKEEGDRVYIEKAQPLAVAESPFDSVRGKSSVKLSTEEIMALTRSEDEP